MQHRSAFLSVVGLAGVIFASGNALAAGAFPGAQYWSGAYIGLQGGWGRDTASYTAPGETVPFGSLALNGWLWGGRAGMDMAMGNMVVGVVTDISSANLNASVVDFGGGGSDVAAIVDAAGSLRARVGMAFNNVLVYGTGGFAIARATATVSNLGPGDPGSDSASNTHTGWTAGVGAELALTNTISFGVEWLYADYGTKSYHFDDGVDTLDANTHLTGNTFMASLNWRLR